MIRPFQSDDMETILLIWFDASVLAHDFVPADFWRAQIDDMRSLYLPCAEIFVYEEQEGTPFGFYALSDNVLAAIFVAPEHQNHGIGKQLLAHAKAQRPDLTLSVYKENPNSLAFYRSQGFKIVNEQIDPHTGHPEYQMVLLQ